MALCLAGGILASSQFEIRPGYLLALIGLLATAAALTIRLPVIASVLLAGAIFLCGAALRQSEHLYFPSDHVGLFSADEPRLGQFKLRLIDEPHLFIGSLAQLWRYRPSRLPRWKWRP